MTFYKFGFSSIKPDTRYHSQPSFFMSQPNAMDLPSAISSFISSSTHSIELSIVANQAVVAFGLSLLFIACAIVSLIVVA